MDRIMHAKIKGATREKREYAHSKDREKRGRLNRTMEAQEFQTVK